MSALNAAPVYSPVLVGAVQFGNDAAVVDMVRSRIPHMRDKSFGPCAALGVVRGGVLLGGVVFHNYQGFCVEVSWAFDSPRWASRDALRTLFSYPFGQLNCVRLTSLAPRSNKKSRKAVVQLGFKLEGVHPKAFDGVQDAMSYGMLRSDCRWIKDRE
jgi:RimJ/RimL family protein N-acetyltransferase